MSLEWSRRSGLACLLGVMLVPAAHAVCQVLDADQHLIRLDNPARRVISLSPDLTETLFAIGAGDRIVGVIQGSDYPPSAKRLPSVGSYTGLDLEKIISLHPDLIVTWGHGFSRSLSGLRAFGIPVYVSNPIQLSDVPQTMENLGCLTGVMEQAQRVAGHFRQRLRVLSSRGKPTQPQRVFYQIDSQSLITINRQSWINQAIDLCGGVNVFASSRFTAPEVSMESILTVDPDVIVSDATDPTWRKRWLKWPSLRAVKNQRLFTIPADELERPGPRLLQGIEKLCRDLEF